MLTGYAISGLIAVKYNKLPMSLRNCPGSTFAASVIVQEILETSKIFDAEFFMQIGCDLSFFYASLHVKITLST